VLATAGDALVRVVEGIADPLSSASHRALPSSFAVPVSHRSRYPSPRRAVRPARGRESVAKG
jgi:hypothetical protein